MSLGDCIGKKFNRLTVLEEWRDKKIKRTRCKCICDCGNIINTDKYSVTHGKSKSCGCYREERKESNKKYNKYDLSKEYGIGYTFKDEAFYFDLEDYDKIKDYCWCISNGYIGTCIKNNKIIRLHRLIMNVLQDENIFIDHINRNRLDNRKENLRVVKKQENCINKSIPSTNTSGFMGVQWYKSRNKWVATLAINKKNKFLGYYNIKEDAIIARLNGEKKYYGEFAPQRHLFNKYGIGDED